MPPIEEADYIHCAVVWKCIGYTRDNEPILDPPKQTGCRFVWDERMSTDEKGIPIQVSGDIAMSFDVHARSLVWFGSLSTYNPAVDQEIYEIISKEKAYSLDGKNIRREYMLSRFRGSLPEGSIPEV